MERGLFCGKRPFFEWKEAEFTKFLTFNSISTSDVNQMC